MRKYSWTTKENSRQISRRERLRAIVALGVVAILLLYLLPRFVGGAASLVFSPIVRFESWVAESGSSFPRYIQDRNELMGEIEKLKIALQSSNRSRLVIENLKRENTELRALLSNASSTRIAAAVVGRPTETPYDVLILDKGSRDGVIKHAPVYADSDHVIGFVGEVYWDNAVIVLVTTPGLELTVYILGPNIYTTAEGIGGGVLKVSVPQGIALSEGDIVILPSIDTGIFGEISVIESFPTDPEQRGYVTMSVPIQSLRFVAVGGSEIVPVSFEEAVEVVQQVRRDLLTVPVPSGILIDTVLDTGSSTATSTEALLEQE